MEVDRISLVSTFTACTVAFGTAAPAGSFTLPTTEPPPICAIALGPLAAGLFSNDPALADRLLKASDRSGEKMWPLPIYEEYRDQIRSDFADVKNSADRFGGAISAALFLREFAGRTSHWAHLDIAGPAWADSGRHPYLRRGATGAGVRTLLTYLASISAGS